MKKYLGFIITVLLLALISLTLAEAATQVVDVNDAGCTAAASPFCTIQDAIDNATAGDTIDISADSYTENISIDKDLELQGAGTDSTTIVGAPPFHVTSVVTIPDSATTAIIKNLTITGGVGVDGGGINNTGTLTLNDVVVLDNEAENHGGGIHTTGDLTLNNVIVEDNTANSIAGDGLLGIGGGIFALSSGLNITNSSIIGNRAASGGGVSGAASTTINITRSEILNNRADAEFDSDLTGTSKGGGIDAFGSESLTLINSTVKDNIVVSENGQGGGIFSAGTLTLIGSSIIANTISEGTGLSTGFIRGSGIYASGDRATLINSTVSSNSIFTTGIAGDGGALYYQGIDGLFLYNVTITNNDISGVTLNLGATATLRNSIISDQRLGGPDCDTVVVAGSFISDGYNIDSDNTCNLIAAGDQPAVGSVGLLPLADYGGLTQTHNLTDDSPAIDAGDPIVGCKADLDGDGVLESIISSDQRGQIRVDVPGIGNEQPPDQVCDIGAVEFNLLINGMMEDDKDKDSQPDNWMGSNLSGPDKKTCHKKTVNNGKCAMKVKGRNNTTKEVFQVIDRPGGVINQSYELVVYSASMNAAANSLEIAVGFENSPVAPGIIVKFFPDFAIATGTHPYQRFVTSVVAPIVHDRIYVYAISSTMTPAGRVFIDDVSLVPVTIP